jgi:ketosteroid isomerase-like protein
VLDSAPAVAEAFEAAIAERDLEAAVDHGRNAIRGVLAGLIDGGATLSGETVGVYVAGGVALRAVRLRLTGRDPDGEPFETVTDGVTVYALTEAGWRIAIDAPAGLTPAGGGSGTTTT